MNNLIEKLPRHLNLHPLDIDEEDDMTPISSVSDLHRLTNLVNINIEFDIENWNLYTIPQTVETMVINVNTLRLIPPNFFPANLKTLVMTVVGRRPERITNLPIGLEKMVIDDSYLDINTIEFPPNLKKLFILRAFRTPIEIGVLPDSLELLKIEETNLPFSQGSLPDNLKILQITKRFNQEIYPGTLPEGLKLLDLGKNYNTAFLPQALPHSLKGLYMSSIFF